MARWMRKLAKQSHKLAKALAHRDYRAALWRAGVAASIEHERLLRLIPCATVVDIGANRGQFALAVRHAMPESKIISFEPLAGPADRFRSVHGRDPLVTLHQIAIGEACGTATIHVAAEDDSSSLLPITALQTRLYPSTREICTEEIRITQLDQMLKSTDIQSPALLKIDVQGYELRTLHGCEKLMDSFRYIFVECSFVELYEGQALASEIVEFLQHRRFQLRGVYNPSYDEAGRAIQADFLFEAAS